MGVMSCSRDSCTRIMCDTYVQGIGYICPECQNEFKKYLTINAIQAKTEFEIAKALTEFMKSTKGCYDPDMEISIDQFFHDNTR